MNRDLLVIGAGRLGQQVLMLWQARYPEAKLLAETRHPRSIVDKISWRRRDEADPAPFPFVLFCVPPSSTVDYTEEVRRAVTLWSGKGLAVFTSSTAVYEENDGGFASELSPQAATERARRLLAAEAQFLQRGGAVVRLAGLYSVARDPKHFADGFRAAETQAHGWLNLIEESDAAELCCRALELGKAREIYLGCDGTPLPYVASSRGGGRRLRNDWTKERLQWQPRFPSLTAWASRPK